MTRLRILTLALCLLLPAMAPAQPPAADEPPASAFGEQIEVRVVNVEVVVTDKQGNRVPDLQPADFRLTVDGTEMPIQYFTEVRGGQAVAPADAAETAPVSGLPSLAPGEPVGTSYLVFIDDFFSLDSRRDEVLKLLKADLARLGPEDRMAIVAYDGRRLEMLSTWSGSQRELAQAFDRAMTRRAYGALRMAELRSFRNSQRTSNESGFGPMTAFRDRLDFEELDYATRLASQVQRSIAAVASTLRGFAAPPGRKVMLLLSGGWPFSVSQYVTADPTRQVMNRSEVPTGEQLFGPLADAANRLGYTVYPVDVPGLDNGDAPGEFASMASTLREQEVHSGLQHVALQTGGKPLINEQRRSVFESPVADTRSYYWLGFAPEWKGNDKRHDIQVQVLKSGLTVRSRDSFLDLSRKGEVSLRVESAMLFGAPPGTSPMPIEVGKPVNVGRKEMEVPIMIGIPVVGFEALPVDGRYVAELELRVFAVDEKGGASSIPIIPIRVATDEPAAVGKFIRYRTRLKLRRVEQHVVLAIFDPVSGKITTAEVDVAPEKG
jgi:VWFA-related protein